MGHCPKTQSKRDWDGLTSKGWQRRAGFVTTRSRYMQGWVSEGVASGRGCCLKAKSRKANSCSDQALLLVPSLRVIAWTNVTFTGAYFLFWRQICCISNLVVNILGTITFVLASLTDTWLCKNSSENNVIFVLFLNVKIWQEFNIDLKLILKFPLFQIEPIGSFS